MLPGAMPRPVHSLPAAAKASEFLTEHRLARQALAKAMLPAKAAAHVVAIAVGVGSTNVEVALPHGRAFLTCCSKGTSLYVLYLLLLVHSPRGLMWTSESSSSIDLHPSSGYPHG